MVKKAKRKAPKGRKAAARRSPARKPKARRPAAKARQAPARKAGARRAVPARKAPRKAPAGATAAPLSLPAPLAAAVREVLGDWRSGDRTARLWRGEPALWSGRDEDRWVGWLRIVDEMRARADDFRAFAADVRGAGFASVVVLGMGGSSLCPDVLARTFGRIRGFPELLVLDSTVPAQVRALERRLDLAHTLFIVSSKSGTTIEPSVFLDYFLDRTRSALGAEASRRFVAVTDPDSALEAQARREGFRRVFLGAPSVGGRFSALSPFGLAPAAAMGLDVGRLLDRAAAMAEACGPGVPPAENPGVHLGAVMGAAARAGRDKLTVVASPAIEGLGAWLEQLVAESLGKQGKGVVPVAGEPLGPPPAYGADRLFAYVRLSSAPSREQDAAMARLSAAGQPVVRIDVAAPLDLGREFFRWEIATATAGSILGVNPFDQPDVEAAKVAARKVTSAYEQEGRLPDETPALEGDGLRLFADPENARALSAAAGVGSVDAWVRAHLGRLLPGDYFAVNAFVEMSGANEAKIQDIRARVRDRRQVATTVGFGPRFLHSTGQLHKGGPASGVYLHLTADDAEALPIPGRRYDFGVLAKAQASGDFDVLASRGRRILRVHLGRDVAAGLAALRRIVERVT
jgi:transaldolase/glucose-6-phosphate isomerase